MIHLLDKQEYIFDVLKNTSKSKLYWGDRHKEKVQNSLNTYEFYTLPEVEFENKDKIVIQDLDGFFIPFVIEKVRQVNQNGKRSKYVFAEGEHMELRTAQPIAPQTLEGATVKTAADTFLQNTRWQRGIVEFSGSRTIKIDEYMNPLKALQKMRSAFDIELRFRVEISGNHIVARYVDFLLAVGMDNGKETVLGKDLVGIERDEDSKNLYTAVLGMGQANADGQLITFESINGGKNYVEDVDAKERWSNNGDHYWYVLPVESEGDEEITPELVKQKSEEFLAKSVESVVKYKVDAVSLERIFGRSHEKVRKGDTERIKDEKFSPALYLQARVLETERSYTAKDKDSFVLGNYVELNIKPNQQIQAIQKLLFRNANNWSSKTEIHEGPTAPTDKTKKWWDTIENPNILKRWDNNASAWVKATPTEAAEVKSYETTEIDTKDQSVYDDSTIYTEGYAEKKKVKSTTAPSDTSVIWIDTNRKPHVAKVHDGTEWIPITPTSADEIDESITKKWAGQSGADVTGTNTAADTSNVGGTAATTVRDNASSGKSAKDKIDLDVGTETIENTTGSQSKADTAETNAKDHADSLDLTIRGDLQLDAPLPTDVTMNADGITAGADQATSYARMDYRGLYIFGGAIQIDGGLPDSEISNATKWNDRTTKITDAGVYTGIVEADQINVTKLDAISADLGTVTAGSITSNTTINVGTDLTVGNNIYVGALTSTSDKIIEFHEGTDPGYENLIRSSANVDGFGDFLTIQAGFGINLNASEVNANVAAFRVNSMEIRTDSDATYQYTRFYPPGTTAQQIRHRDDGEVAFYANGAYRHVFKPDGSKTGGSIGIDGTVYGMSPIDSPQVLLEYIEFKVPLTTEGTKLFVNEMFIKTVEHFTVFTNFGEIVEIGADYVIVKGEGYADLRIIGERRDYAGVFFDDLSDMEVGAA
jgi:phage minor structural protein